MVTLGLNVRKSFTSIPNVFLKALSHLVNIVFTRNHPMSELKALTESLLNLSQVEKVRVIRHKNKSLNEITFEVLSPVEFDDEVALEKQVINLTVKTELKLRAYSPKKPWFFNTLVLKKFDYELRKGDEIIFNDGRSNILSTAS